MKITNPELKVVRFASEDVIATSVFAVNNGDGTYSVYAGNIDSATSVPYGWHLSLESTPLYNWTSDEYENNKNVLNYGNVYDAYLYQGQYYTNGVPNPITKVEVGGPDPVQGFEPGPAFPMP